MENEDYRELYRKMLNDKAFIKELEGLNEKPQIYEVYKKYGYTNMNYDEFMEEFDARASIIFDTYRQKVGEKKELSDEELDQVVGGLDIFNLICNFVAIVPGIGPVVSGIAKGIKDGVTGKSDHRIAADILTGFALGLADCAFPIFGGAITGGKILATTLGIGAVKLGVTTALDEAGNF